MQHAGRGMDRRGDRCRRRRVLPGTGLCRSSVRHHDANLVALSTCTIPHVRIRHPRLWSPRTWIIWTVGAVIVSGGLTVLLARGEKTPVWPALAALFALAGILATTAGVIANYRRTKRRETLDAWMAWSESSRPHRGVVAKVFGPRKMTDAQARSLILNEGTLVDVNGRDLDPEERRTARNSLSAVLNGLEGLAAGAYLGVYDVRTLAAVGGTIIVGTLRRYEPYVRLRQNTTVEGRAQKTAFEALCVLATDLEFRAQTRHGLQADEERIRYLRGT